VLARFYPGGEGRYPCNGRSREDPVDDAGFVEARSQETGVPGAGADRADAEAIGKNHDRFAHRGQSEGIRSGTDSIEGTGKNIGKAQGTELAGR
jgi:hypothetical protein